MLPFEQLMRCEGEDRLREEAGQLTALMGFEFWAFAVALQPGLSAQPPVWSLDNYPQDLREAHLCSFARHASRRLPDGIGHGIPRGWSTAARTSGEDAGDKSTAAFRKQARRYGVHGGLWLPLQAGSRFSGLTLATCRPVEAQALREAQPSALLFVSYLHMACLPCIERFRDAQLPRLRSREVECLSWAAMGKTTWEISRVLEISVHTVIYHLRNAAAKLGAVSRQQAIARAIDVGILQPNGGVVVSSRRSLIASRLA